MPDIDAETENVLSLVSDVLPEKLRVWVVVVDKEKEAVGESEAVIEREPVIEKDNLDLELVPDEVRVAVADLVVEIVELLLLEMDIVAKVLEFDQLGVAETENEEEFDLDVDKDGETFVGDSD